MPAPRRPAPASSGGPARSTGCWPRPTPTPGASSTSTTPSSCSSSPCSARRPPTSGSTPSVRPCSRPTRRAARWPAAEREQARADHRPAGLLPGQDRVAAQAQRRPSSSGYDGEVPPRLDDLVTLPGVGRKTANVVLGNAFGIPGITVDTHFGRLARRFGWTEETDPVKVEHAVGALFPKRDWMMLSHHLIWHGRRVLPRPASRPAAPARSPAGARRTARGPTDPVDRGQAGARPRAAREAPRSLRSPLASPLRLLVAAGVRRPRPTHARPRRRPRSTSTPRSCAALKEQAGVEDCAPGRRRPGRRRAARRDPALPRRRPRRRPGRAARADGASTCGRPGARPAARRCRSCRRSTTVRRPGAACSASTSRTRRPAAAHDAGREQRRRPTRSLADPQRRPRTARRPFAAPARPAVHRASSTPTARSPTRSRRRSTPSSELADLVHQYLGVSCERSVDAPASDLPEWLRAGRPGRRGRSRSHDLTRFMPPEDADARRGAVLMLFGEGTRRVPTCCSPSGPTTCAPTPARSPSPAGSIDPGETAGRGRAARGREETGLRPRRRRASSPSCPSCGCRPATSRSRRCSAGGASRARSRVVDPDEVHAVYRVPLARAARPDATGSPCATRAAGSGPAS